MSSQPQRDFSFSFVSGYLTFRFDVSPSNGEVVVTEFHKLGQAVESSAVVIPAKAIPLFEDALCKARAWLERQPTDSRIIVVKKQHGRAYERWSSDEDTRLAKEFQAGTSIRELAELFQRQPSAIQSRLAKLGLQG